MKKSLKVKYEIQIYCHSFEKQLKTKIAQKIKRGADEEGLLLRYFKYFDVTNKGLIGKSSFQKTMDRIGVVIDHEVLFKHS